MFTRSVSTPCYTVWLKRSLMSVLLLLCAASSHALTCSVGDLISETFTNGSQWELCFTVDANAGIVLHDATLSVPGPSGTTVTRRVLEEASLAQVHVAFDDGAKRTHFLTQYGFGGGNLVNLGASDCVGGTLRSVGGKNVLCHAKRDRGYAWKYYTQAKQGETLNLTSVSVVQGYTWVVEWHFHDDGVIAPRIGATGELERFGSQTQFGWPLDASGTVGLSSSVNYFWRLDFGIGADSSDDKIEEFEILPTDNGSKHRLVRAQLTQEAGRRASSDVKRSWRIYDGETNFDGHLVSYHLEALHTGHRYWGPTSEPWSENEFWVTRDSPCQRYISENDTVGGGCGADVSVFENSQNINGADLVVWYGLSYHHLPRDESEPYMPTRWDGFELVPRDWTYDNPFSQVPSISRDQLASILSTAR